MTQKIADLSSLNIDDFQRIIMAYTRAMYKKDVKAWRKSGKPKHGAMPMPKWIKAEEMDKNGIEHKHGR